VNDASRRTALVVIASSVGTAFEWYDFFLFGTLASLISGKFTAGSKTAGFLFILGAFAAGFIVRPFGAVFFGHIGDRHGRKSAFLLTIVLMGAATTAIGLLPTIQSIGVAAPLLLVATRVVQGFAMGGEYGGAAVYVAEHAQSGRRGFLTGWIQSTAALGLLLAVAAVLGVRVLIGERAFGEWGWRVPFLFSAILLALSLWIRLKLGESPVYQRMRAQMAVARAPLREALRGENLRRIGLALVCILLAQGAVWYTAHFYAQFFLEQVLKVDAPRVNLLIMAAVLLSAPGYLFFGWLSDRVGRKPVMLAGMGLTLLLYFPGFHALTSAANPALVRAARAAPVVVVADPASCHTQFDVLGRHPARSACDVLRTTLADGGIPNHLVGQGRDGWAAVYIAGTPAVQGTVAHMDERQQSDEMARLAHSLKAALQASGYGSKADRVEMKLPLILGMLLLLMLASTALYGPQAAALAELFPTSIRYTALSVPYNIGVGWVGGLLPVSAFALVAATGDIYSGLYYPLVFTAISFICCWLWLPETSGQALQQTGEHHVS